MKLLVGGGFVAVAAVLLYVFVEQKPADVFDMPVKDAYAKLTQVDFGPLSEGQKVLNTVNRISGNGQNRVTWTQQGDMARFECAIDLAPLPRQAAIPGVREQVTLRIDQDVLDYFREDGPGWQDRINAALRAAAGK